MDANSIAREFVAFSQLLIIGQVFEFFGTISRCLQKTIVAGQTRGGAAVRVVIKLAVQIPKFDPSALGFKQRLFRFAETFDMSLL